MQPHAEAHARGVLTEGVGGESVREDSEGRQTVLPGKLLSWAGERGPSAVLAGRRPTGGTKSELGDGWTGGKCGEEEEAGGRKG